jgi:UDP-glucose 4-epimerase
MIEIWMCKMMKFSKYLVTGGVDGGHGWRGDVKTMLLSVDRLLNLGCKRSMSSEEAVRLCCQGLLQSYSELL